MVCKYERMPQPQQQSNLAFFDGASGAAEFSVVLRGYDRAQVDNFIQQREAVSMVVVAVSMAALAWSFGRDVA